jgi:hypothetical protein
MFAADMQFDPEKVIDAFVAFLQPYLETTGALSSVQAQQLMLKIYQLRFGFTTEQMLAHQPASLVKFHKAEDPYLGNTREDHLEDFADLRIGEIFNISFFDYLRQPRHELRQMRDRAQKYRQTKNNFDRDAMEKAEKKAREAGLI